MTTPSINTGVPCFICQPDPDMVQQSMLDSEHARLGIPLCSYHCRAEFKDELTATVVKLAKQLKEGRRQMAKLYY